MSRLPAAAWGEKDGTVTNSERRISRQRPLPAAPGEARPDWWIIAEVAKRMGFGDAFAYESPAEIFAEHAALSGFENDGARDFDIGAFAGIDRRDDYDALMAPFQWPRAEGRARPARRASSRDGGFFTADRKARFVARLAPPLRDARRPTTSRSILNTGRVRDHWHTMTRTGKSPRLSQHIAEPFVEIHPDDAARLGVGRPTSYDCDAAWRGRRARARLAAPGARLRLRADALDRPVRREGARSTRWLRRSPIQFRANRR